MRTPLSSWEVHRCLGIFSKIWNWNPFAAPDDFSSSDRRNSQVGIWCIWTKLDSWRSEWAHVHSTTSTVCNRTVWLNGFFDDFYFSSGLCEVTSLKLRFVSFLTTIPTIPSIHWRMTLSASFGPFVSNRRDQTSKPSIRISDNLWFLCVWINNRSSRLQIIVEGFNLKLTLDSNRFFIERDSPLDLSFPRNLSIPPLFLSPLASRQSARRFVCSKPTTLLLIIIQS